MAATAGKRAFASDVNAITNSSSGKPLIRLVQQTTQSIPSNADTAVLFGAGSEEYDLSGWHDVATNTSRITPNVAGYISLRGKVWWAADTDLIAIHAAIGKNSSIVERNTILLPATVTASTPRSVEVFARLACNGTTDYFELAAKQLQTGAGSLGTNIATGMSCVFEAEYLRPL